MGKQTQNIDIKDSNSKRGVKSSDERVSEGNHNSAFSGAQQNNSN
jgi:hypothetical protein